MRVLEHTRTDSFASLFGERRGSGRAREPAPCSRAVWAAVSGPGIELHVADCRAALSELEDGVLGVLGDPERLRAQRGTPLAAPKLIMCAKLCATDPRASRQFGMAADRYELTIDTAALAAYIAAERPAAWRLHLGG